MASLIESLINEPVQRKDDVRLTIAKRPPPIRTRQLLEQFITMGAAASLQAVNRSINFKTADPQTMVFTVLGRWPTKAEAAAFEEPYQAWPHMKALLRSHEFRRHFPRRAAEAFSERRRLLFVRIPSSGGKRVVATLNSKHPILPTDLTDRSYNDADAMAKTLGTVLGRMNISNSLAIIHTSMALFYEEPATGHYAADALGWHLPLVPCRTGDLLFALMRDPTERALAFVNQAVADFVAGEAPLPESVRADYRNLTDIERAALSGDQLRTLARRLLAQSLYKDPICHALVNGTAEDALACCRCAPLHLLPPAQFSIWGRSSLDVIPAEGPPPPDSILRPEDLTRADQDAIADATAQDRIVFDRFQARHGSSGLPAIMGRDL